VKIKKLLSSKGTLRTNNLTFWPKIPKARTQFPRLKGLLSRKLAT
jgi:hypothetical protein